MTYILLFLFTFLSHPSLEEVRNSYAQASKSKDAAYHLYERLKPVRKGDSGKLLAYKGALLALVAKFEKNKEAKKQNFKNGVALIEYAIAEHPNDVEIRFIRLSVQENAPKFLKYKKNLEEDKAFVLEHFQLIKSRDLKKLIIDYAGQSGIFLEEEKNRLK